MSYLTDEIRIGACLKSRISELRNGYERKLEEIQEVSFFPIFSSWALLFLSFYLDDE
jgi:hypothetical protein